MDKETLMTILKDIIDPNKKTLFRVDSSDDGYEALWRKHIQDSFLFFDIVFSNLKYKEIGELIGCDEMRVKNIGRIKAPTRTTYLQFLKLLDIKLYLMMISDEEFEDFI